MNKFQLFFCGVVGGASLITLLGFTTSNQKYNIPFESSDKDDSRFIPIATLSRQKDAGYQLDFYQYRGEIFIANSRGGIIQIQK